MTFHIIEPHRPYTIAGIVSIAGPSHTESFEMTIASPLQNFVPIEVEHGFSSVPAATSSGNTANNSPRPAGSTPAATTVVPYMTLAFLIEDKVLWMTDASVIPQKAWDILHYGLSFQDSQGDSTDNQRKRRLAIAFVDLSEIYPLRAHLSLRTFLQVVDKLEATETYAIGMNHTLCHGEIEALGEEVQSVRRAGREDDFLRRVLFEGEKIAGDEAWDRLKEKKAYFRPSFDGMVVELEVEGE